MVPAGIYGLNPANFLQGNDMPIIERDPWRTQYFERVSCPDEVVIPTDASTPGWK